jgi:hypothetical protein
MHYYWQYYKAEKAKKTLVAQHNNKGLSQKGSPFVLKKTKYGP